MAGAAGASQVTRFVIENLLGWELDEEKRVSSADSAEVLGVTVAVVDEPVRHCRAPPVARGGGTCRRPARGNCCAGTGTVL